MSIAVKCLDVPVAEYSVDETSFSFVVKEITSANHDKTVVSAAAFRAV